MTDDFSESLVSLQSELEHLAAALFDETTRHDTVITHIEKESLKALNAATENATKINVNEAQERYEKDTSKNKSKKEALFFLKAAMQVLLSVPIYFGFRPYLAPSTAADSTG
jgi:hypothetical protein